MSEDNNSEEKKKVSNKFIDSIKSWVVLDDKIKKLKEEIKTLTTDKTEYEKIVLEELDKMDEKVISISDGKLRKNVTKTQVPLKKEHIQKTILDLTKDQIKATSIFNDMMKSRQTVERVNLKRTKNRDPKSTDKSV
jgi:hypothetical protein